MARTTKQDSVRDLQRTLYRAAKADPGRRFHALYDKIYRRDVLEHAWGLVRANRGAAGIDRQTIADVEAYGSAKLLDGLAADLGDGSYRALPARRVFIPKPGRPDEQRPLSIPAVRDRVVQAAVKIVIEPIFEADFLPCSFGFRPKRAQHDALQVLVDQSWRGRRWVVESDVANCFEAIPHSGLMSAIEERISDRHLLKLLRAMLRSGVMQDGAVMRSDDGTPQGGVVSPLLCNVYLHRLDRCWAQHGAGMLVRFADDLVVMCHSRVEAERPRGVAGDPRRARPHAQGGQDADRGTARGRGGPGLSGLSSPLGAREHARLAASVLPGPLPRREKMQHARDRLRELTLRKRLLLPVDEVVGDLNEYLRGFAGHFRYGNSARSFGLLDEYAIERLALFLAKRHKKKRGYGYWRIARSPDRMGLIRITGTVVAPRPNRARAG
jgi:retron-type reverse transcriptase